MVCINHSLFVGSLGLLAIVEISKVFVQWDLYDALGLV